MSVDDTIFALSSGRPPAGLAVVRVSGYGTRFGLDMMIGTIPEPRKLTYAEMRSKAGLLLDHGLAAFFPAPHSFTGQDTAEYHLHGGPAVVAAVLDELGRLNGYRLAEPGEFTRRAFDQGKLDLVQVEGLADLIAAETEVQRVQALRQADGASSAVLGRWRDELIGARGLIEAELDFSDEEDVPDSVSDRVWVELAVLKQDIVNHVSDARGERVRDGIEVVVLGPPNAGKSSLVNALARRDVAIVADEPGTTRDLIEVRLDLGGLPVTVVDTAGLRDEAAAGSIEAEGMRRANLRASAADLALWLQDLSAPAPASEPALGEVPHLRIGTKADLIDSDPQRSMKFGGFDAIVSVVAGTGMEEMVNLLRRRAASLVGGGESAIVTRARHRQALSACADAIGQAVDGRSQPLEIRAEALRRASDALGRVTGAVDVEDLLDVIFRDFCVGK